MARNISLPGWYHYCRCLIDPLRRHCLARRGATSPESCLAGRLSGLQPLASPLPRGQEEGASNSYFNLKGRRSSDGSTQRITPNSDDVRSIARSPMEVCDPGAAHGQIDPVPEEAHAPGLQNTEHSGATSDGVDTYHFVDRPGEDREAPYELRLSPRYQHHPA
jgi:hypothetical protein